MSAQTAKLTLTTVSSLEKIFPDETFTPETPCDSATMLLGERFSFQAACCLDNDKVIYGSVKLTGPLSEYVCLSRVGYAPSQFPNYPDADDFVLRTRPGLYPDPLYPMNGKLTLIPGQWNSLFITVPAECPLPAGTFSLTLQYYDDTDTLLAECTFTLTRLPAKLPEQTLLHTEWFHTDCIADWYQVSVFSERWWQLVEQYASCAVRYGANMLLTPIFTPPLDTAPGKERTTVQLVDVYHNENGYSFAFDRLERWIAMCDRCGIRYIEFSHLFTQWGAKHAPKIMVYEKSGNSEMPADSACKDEPVKHFGWETDAKSVEYKEFLDAFLPDLLHFIHTHGLETRCFFHVSDEPSKEQLPDYLYAKKLLQSHTKNLPVMDAISDIDFYEQGIIRVPVCTTDHIEPFLDHHVPHLWAYYCCAQYKDVANRFFCMPSARNRILGVQLYYYHIEGFLQWGFNFWNAAYSTHRIDPFANTDADLYFPSGDSFLVYPGEDGPLASLRAEVFMEGLQDMRALCLLEALEGRSAVEELINETLSAPLTFKQYPKDAAWLLKLRETCNLRIAALSKQQKA